nr:type II toxin-antitoxin system YafQ family toxin [Bifidobacterium tissieri]
MLSTKYRDHQLTGPWRGYRELHITGDWLLIYRIESDELLLVLTRTGSHDTLYSGRTAARQIRAYGQRTGHEL